MATLKRKPVLEDADLALMKQKGELADKVNKLLGYNMLGFTKKVKELGNALYELDIKPFSPSSVKKYKVKMLHTKHRDKVKWQSLGAAMIVIAVAILPGFYELFHKAPVLGETLSWILAISSLITGICMLAHAADFRSQNEWRRISLAGYDEDVPEFALMRAVQIKEKVPAASFTVEYLVHTESYQPKTVDPFLIVSLGDEQYYIDVWNEPQFEREL